MKLFTKPILKRLQGQFTKESVDLSKLKVISKIFHPLAEIEYYLLFQNPDNPDQLKAIIKGDDIDLGDLSMEEIENTLFFNYPLERETEFEPTPAEHVWEKLLRGEAV